MQYQSSKAPRTHHKAAFHQSICSDDASLLPKHLSEKMTLKEEFEQYAENVKKIKTRPTDDELLHLYGLYKQAVVGDVNTAKPGMMDMKGKAKWDAWNSRKGMSNEDAMNAYISLAKGTIEKYGL